MKLFDAQLRSDACSDDDLQNLHYFETEHVVTTAHAARDFERAEDLLEYFDGLTTDEFARLSRAGLEAHVALGVLPDARPRRAHFEVWDELPFMLEQPEVVALGEVGAWVDQEDHWELFERQVEIAKEVGPIPVIATPPGDLRVNMTYKMMQRFQDLGYPPHLVMMNRLDERLVETVVRDGFVAGVAVGGADLEPREAAPMLADAVDELGSPERIVLASSIRAGGSDVLSIPKTVVAMQDCGLDTHTIERLGYGNAKGLFLREPRHLE